MRKAIFAIALCIVLPLSAQNTKPLTNYNFNFEEVAKGQSKNVSVFGSKDYVWGLDSTTVHSGKYSNSIAFGGASSDYKALSIVIPDNYEGKKITLTGYLKTEGVEDGFAGLWMRIDPNVGFDNMSKRGIKGTTDWTKYEITLDMKPEETQQIVVGALLVGKGKIWVDDLQVMVDGKAIETIEAISFKADKDHEFDKGSNIAERDLNQIQIQNLKALGMVWGYLKYYHPSIAKGEYNWDYELFRMMPKILEAGSVEKRDEILLAWMESLGSFEKGKPKKIKVSKLKQEPDLDWIKKTGFSSELQTKLMDLKNAKRSIHHYYIDLNTGIDNPKFKHENAYASMKYPDFGFRILALYRYWNIIHYYFPNTKIMDEDWSAVLGEYVVKFSGAKDETQYALNMLELIGRIHDTHANVWGENESLNAFFGNNYAALELSFIENKAVVTGYLEADLGAKTGLINGDIITEINGKKVTDIIQDRLKYTPASNYPTQLRDIARNLLRTNDSVLQVKFIRDKTEENMVLNAYSTKIINLYSKFYGADTSFRMLDNNIAYINHGNLRKAELPALWEKFKNTEGLIIDDRNYPGDFPLFELGQYLMEKGVPYVKFSYGSVEMPGRFIYKEEMKVGSKNKDYYKGEVVILVNEVTQSSAEYHCMAYRQAENATVMGSTTAGADGDISFFYLPGGIRTAISGLGVYYPDGGETQRVGIVPDVVVTPSIEGVKMGKDEVLEKAIELILK